MITENKYIYFQVQRIIPVAIPLSGLTFAEPKYLPTNSSKKFVASLSVYTPADTTVSWDLGDGFLHNSSSNFSITHTYLSMGTYNCIFKVSNKVNSLTRSWTTVVQDTLSGASFEHASYKIIAAENASLTVLLKRGSHFKLAVDFGDGKTTSTVHTNYTSEIHIHHVYSSPGRFIIRASFSNDVSVQLTASTSVLVQTAISGLTMTVTCQSDFGDCFQHDDVTVTPSVTDGTNATFVFRFGSGEVINSSSPYYSAVTYRYTAIEHGTLVINVTAYNNISSQTETKEFIINELVAVNNMEISCTLTKLRDTTNCSLRVGQGTGK